MDLNDFLEIYTDKKSDDLPNPKMKHKYGAQKLGLYLSNLKSSFYEPIKLLDAAGQPLVFLPGTRLTRIICIDCISWLFGILRSRNMCSRRALSTAMIRSQSLTEQEFYIQVYPPRIPLPE